jgi:hypothetical protein
LNEAGQKAVHATAERLAALVDRALGEERGTSAAAASGAGEAPMEPREATCSCGSGVPVTRVMIGGNMVELVALPLILGKFHEAGRGQDEQTISELLDTVRIYNAVPPGEEASYREVVRREYAAFCRKEQTQ